MSNSGDRRTYEQWRKDEDVKMQLERTKELGFNNQLHDYFNVVETEFNNLHTQSGQKLAGKKDCDFKACVCSKQNAFTELVLKSKSSYVEWVLSEDRKCSFRDLFREIKHAFDELLLNSYHAFEACTQVG